MGAEHFPVVGGKDHQRVVIKAQFLEPGEQTAYVPVRAGGLGVINAAPCFELFPLTGLEAAPVVCVGIVFRGVIGRIGEGNVLKAFEKTVRHIFIRLDILDTFYKLLHYTV